MQPLGRRGYEAFLPAGIEGCTQTSADPVSSGAVLLRVTHYLQVRRAAGRAKRGAVLGAGGCDRRKNMPGYEVKTQSGQTVVFSTCNYSSGVAIRINKGARTLTVDGWYDSMVGIQGFTIPLDELINLFKPAPRKRTPSCLCGGVGCNSCEPQGRG